MQQLHWKQPAVLQVNIPHNLSKHGGITPKLLNLIYLNMRYYSHKALQQQASGYFNFWTLQ